MRKLREKRGAALVSAITFMLVMIVLGVLLTSAMSYSHLQLKTNQAVEKAWLQKENIGEYFVHQVSDTNASEFQTKVAEQTPYVAEVTVNETEKNLTLRNKRGSVVLYIQAEGENVITWRYSQPQAGN